MPKPKPKTKSSRWPVTIFVKRQEPDTEQEWLEGFTDPAKAAEIGTTVSVGTYLLSEVRKVKLVPTIE